MICRAVLSSLILASAVPLFGQNPVPAAPAAPAAPAPTWETQKQARTYLLGIPAPRGQIVDRNGSPLAQSRVSYNLAIAFPTPLNFSDHDVINFAKDQIVRAQVILGRQIPLSANGANSIEGALKHYKNRGIIPYVIAQDLRPAELELIKRAKSENLILQPVYQRFYPNGSMAGHVIGYAGRTGRRQDGPLENNELLWPDAEGREGLEQTFNDQLQGKLGQYNISFDATGKKASEQISIPPQPGYNVVTTLDARVQRLCEESLAKSCRRGAIVILDPNTGDILGLASWPTINPNAFIPKISDEAYKALNDDKDIPLYPRAFRASYPPGSTFKVFVGMAALQSGKVKIDDEYNCPASLEIGNLSFRNWKRDGSGSLNFADALTQSCNTWFYQVGMKIGSRPIIDYAQKVGLGMKTGIPLNAETEGRIPTDEYMLKNYKRRLLNGDVANLSIGQGDTLVSPLQMAQAMGVVGNGGTFYQTRLVQQVQSIDGQIVTAYDVRVRGQIELDKEVLAELHKAMVQVVESGAGTAHKAQVSGVHVAGKTGTAQWGPKSHERTAAWFAGFAPADKPKYAFAALYESDSAGSDVHGGTVSAPLIGRVLRELFKEEPKESKGKTRKRRKAVVDEEDVPVRRAEPVQPN
ncbi:MAG: Peptidoglycan glycosyltransferase [Chthoniobacteraceae bacterium]|nr:Peptidoglycan glycosyltransferase [Chthoniobacteraceae bacterium]